MEFVDLCDLAEELCEVVEIVDVDSMFLVEDGIIINSTNLTKVKNWLSDNEVQNVKIAEKGETFKLSLS